MPLPGASPHRFGDVRRLGEIDSTNRYALDAARDGTPAGLVVVADHQSAGRGRLGRTWSAPSGSSLLMSVLLRPDVPAAQRHLVVLAAAVAMAEAVEGTTGVRAVLKWPNDLLVGNRKLAGILAEAIDDAVVVGIGVNLDWPSVPEELAEIATACNLEGGRPTTRELLLSAFLERYDERLGDLPAARVAYVERLDTLGREVRVEQADGAVLGVAVDLDESGRLLVRTESGEVQTISAGDVVHLRPV